MAVNRSKLLGSIAYEKSKLALILLRRPLSAGMSKTKFGENLVHASN